MRILPYYVIHTVKNAIKKLFKTWVAVFLAICLGFGLIGGIIGFVAGSTIEDTVIEEEYSEDELELSEEEFTEEDKTIINAIVRAAIILVSLLVILFSIYGGDKSGTKIFTMPDVNFLFPSPLSPQSVLMFRMVLQMGVAILSSVYLLFQIPNLLNAGLSLKTCLTLFLCYAFMLYFSRLAAVFTYTVTASKEKLRKYIRPFVLTVIALIVFSFAAYSKLSGMGYLDAALNIFSSKHLDYIPFFGWLSGLVFASQTGNFTSFIVFLLLIILFMILSTMIIWKIKADFYEDALNFASENQAVIEASKNGERLKRKKNRSEKITRNSEFKGEGAYLFFSKTVYNRKRFAKLGIFSATGFTYTAIALVLAAALKLIFSVNTILPAVITILVFVFFRNFGNPLAEEMSHDFIFTVPESPHKKVLFAILGGLFESVLDLLPAVIILAVTFPQQILNIAIWYVLWISLDLFCSSTGLFIELLLPSTIIPTIKAMFNIMIRMFVILPGVILVIVAAAIQSSVPLLIAVLLNLIISAIMLGISPQFLHSGKK